MTGVDIERLGASRFVSLTTFRRDGTAVATPVWVARDGSRLLVWTGKRTGKAKRLRHTAAVTLAPSSPRGRPRADPVRGTARLLADAELGRVERLLAAKYRVGWPALRLLTRVLRLVRGQPPSEPVGIEITLA